LRCRRPLPLLSDGGAAEWNAARARHAASGHELAGIVGVVGYGNIGRAVAAMFRGFGLEVVRAERAGQEDAAVPALPLDELLARADIVVVCLPARADTRGLFDANRIARMKPGATLIHVGRGGVVDDAAVAAAIAEGRLAGAGFDVFETEPPPPDHPFLTLAPEARARLVLTPHIGGQTLESKARNFAVSLDNVQRVARGEAPLYRVPAGRARNK
jgi:phosphoglycerate dehydrogenase-like enzyme